MCGISYSVDVAIPSFALVTINSFCVYLFSLSLSLSLSHSHTHTLSVGEILFETLHLVDVLLFGKCYNDSTISIHLLG